MTERIAIIGGGPAGLTAAIEAARAGFEVQLYESNIIGENINCAEGFFDTMNLLNPPDEGILFQVKTLLVEYEDNYKIDVKNQPIWMIDRKVWQQFLARRAIKLGVKIYENYRIKETDLNKLKNNFDWVLDGSGVPSISSLKYHFRKIYEKEALITVQYKIKGAFSNYNQAIKAVLFNDGYGWIFPKSKTEANIGLGIFNLKQTVKIKGIELYNRLDNFIDNQGISGKTLERSAGICPNIIPYRISFDNILLIGDAAGLTSPIHGGGIDLACISAITAVKMLSKGKGHKYEDELRKILNQKMRNERIIRNLWLNDGNFISKILKIIDNGINIKNILWLVKKLPMFLGEPGLLKGLFKYIK